MPRVRQARWNGEYFQVSPSYGSDVEEQRLTSYTPGFAL